MKKGILLVFSLRCNICERGISLAAEFNDGIVICEMDGNIYSSTASKIEIL